MKKIMCILLLIIPVFISYAFLLTPKAEAMLAVNSTQQNYRWRNDNGTETTATWKANANTSITGISIGSGAETIRLRISYNEIDGGTTANIAAQIQVGTNADCSTGMTALNTSSTSWQIVSSSNFTNLAATTQQVGTGTFVAGYMSESSNPVTAVALLAQVSESEWAIKGVNATPNTTYYFRVTNNGTALTTYTNCAQLTTTYPTKIVFDNPARTFTAGCNGAANVFTITLKNPNDIATTPQASTVVRVTSNTTSGSFAVYSDDTCSTPVTNGDFTFTTAQATKSAYIIDGKKSATTWTLSATRQSGDTLTTGTQTYTVNGGAVTRLVITLPTQSFTDGSGNSGSVTNRTAGSSFNITSISATDNYFNVNTGYSGSKTLVYSGPANAPNSQAPSYTTSVSFTNGQSTTTLATTLYKAESVTITVTDGGSYGYASSSVTVDTGALDNFLVTATTPQTAGVCFTGTNTITARDTWNNTRTTDTSVVNMTDTGTSITYYTTAGCSNPTTQYTMSSGTATMYISTNKKQTLTITATKNASIETGTSASITVNPGTVTRLVITLPTQSFTDGSGNSGSVTNRTAGSSFNITSISATDNYFNVNTGYSGSKTLVYSGPANAPNSQAPSYTTSVSFTNGQSTTTLATTLYKAESVTITVTDGGSYGYASSSVTVDTGAANNYNVTPAGASQTAGVAFNVTITARDTWHNNKGSSYSPPGGTYSWTTSGANAPDSTAPSLGTLTQGDFTNGATTKSITLYKAENGVTITATEPGPGITGTSTAIDVSPGSISGTASDSSVAGNSTATTNIPITITVTLKDTWRNPISGVSASNITLGSTGGTFTQPSSPTDANGQTTGDVYWSTIGAKTVDATISTASLVQDDGSTPDADGKLDSTLAVTASDPIIYKTQINSGLKINSGLRIN